MDGFCVHKRTGWIHHIDLALPEGGTNFFYQFRNQSRHFWARLYPSANFGPIKTEESKLMKVQKHMVHIFIFFIFSRCQTFFPSLKLVATDCEFHAQLEEMSFYDPENITDPAVIEYERNHRILQPIWEFIVKGNEDFLRSPLCPPTVGVVFYILATIPFTIVDVWFQDFKCVQKRKLQPQREVTWPMIKNSMGNLFWNHLLFIIPLALVQLIWVPPTPLPPLAPTLFQFTWHLAAFFIVFDFEYWAWHALHHKVRFLYRWCHSVHHQYHAPFAFVTQYLHPWELFCVGMGISITPWFFKPHCLTYWCWFCVSNWVSIEVHCGYDLPWGIQHFFPFYGGAPSHDLHHNRPLTNFEPWLNWLDRLCGWRLTYKEVEEMKRNRKIHRLGKYTETEVEGLKKWN